MRLDSNDELLERLGEDWRALDDVLPHHRIYVRWALSSVGRPYLAGLCIDGVPVTAELLRFIRVGRLENSYSAGAEPTTPFRRRWTGEDPHEFSTRVAVHYRYLASISPHPAKLIAGQAGVPVATVHGWIREARLRGKLPPGHRGKAG